jgi:hypothetical protein
MHWVSIACKSVDWSHCCHVWLLLDYVDLLVIVVVSRIMTVGFIVVKLLFKYDFTVVIKFV